MLISEIVQLIGEMSWESFLSDWFRFCVAYVRREKGKKLIRSVSMRLGIRAAGWYGDDVKRDFDVNSMDEFSDISGASKWKLLLSNELLCTRMGVLY